jgi:hypothetical protein
MCDSTAARESALVTVDIGEAKTRYTVHRTLLAEHSDYFRKALSGPWKEAEEGIVTLEDVDCQTCKHTLADKFLRPCS